MSSGAALTAGVEAFLGLGSNLGDRDAHLLRAIATLGATPGVRVLATSTIRETEPVGGPPQPRYKNAVAKLRTTLPPHALLALCQQIERDAGRVRGPERNLARPLDIDVLLFGDLEIDSKDLVVPHPRLFEREFVLTPLRELGVAAAALPRPVRPRILHEASAFAELSSRWQSGGCSLGLVPTMGALHEGHASLLRRARAECDRVAATIFVNPLQFAPYEDLARYPRPFQADVELCRAAGADAVFAPSVAEMYPEGFASKVAVGAEALGMEGAARPSHFSGVATVVAKLFAIARPTVGYFGKKDAQQVAVLKRLVKDLGFPIVVRECEIVRESDGLALSSRNVYLSKEDRAAAPVLARALQAARALHLRGERDQDRLLAAARAELAREPRAALEYLELRNDADLLPLPPGEPVRVARLLVVARFGSPPVRLLDNMTIGDARDA